MLVTKKETFVAETFSGTFDSMVRLVKAFPDAVFKVYLDEGKLCVEVKVVAYAQEYIFVNPGEWVVLEPELGYTVHSPESFHNDYELAAKAELNSNPLDSEPVWRHTPVDEHSAALYDG